MKGFDAWLTTQPEPDPICAVCHGDVEAATGSEGACVCPEECVHCGAEPGKFCLDPPGGLCEGRFTFEQNAVIAERERKLQEEYEREAQPEPDEVDEPPYDPVAERADRPGDDAAGDFAFDAQRERRRG